MSKIIQFDPNAHKKPTTAKNAAATPQKPIIHIEPALSVEYLDALRPLADQAKEIADKYGFGAKDVLTDALCLLIEDAIVERCKASKKP